MSGLPADQDHRGDHEGGDSSGELATEAFWDERYQSSSSLWSGHVNPHLVAEASGLTPSSVLDVGCGEGADAVWLAQHGWHVTAVDVSAVALARGAAHALKVSAETAGRITWLHGDLIAWAPPKMSYDLVSAQFIHLPQDQRDVLHRRLADSVAPGGTLLIVGHHPSDLGTTVPRPSAPGLLFTASEVADSIATDEWVILVEEARARRTIDPDGRPATIHDAVLRAQRIS